MSRQVNKKPRLVLAGGGSGGHLTPSIAVANEFKRKYPKGEVLFVVSKLALDYEIINGAGFDSIGIFTAKLRRYFSLRNFVDIFTFIYLIFRCIYILKKFDADIVFTKGGFIALPVAVAAKILHIPVLAHESDMVQGLANRIIAKFAKVVCVSFPSVIPRDAKLKNKYVHTGTPIRTGIFSAVSSKGVKFLNFKTKKPIVLFMGASQGANQINDICRNLLPNLSKTFNIVLISGRGKSIMIKSKSFREYEYLDSEFPNVLKAADFVVSRGGANSLFELSAMKKASVIIPLDYAAGDHQRKNADMFVSHGAVISINPMNPDIEEVLRDTLIDLLNYPKKKKQLETRISTMRVDNAKGKIVGEVSKLL